jgi:hypothetical protein
VLFSRDHLNTTLAFPATAVAAVNVGAVSSQMGSSVTLATVQPIDDTKVGKPLSCDHTYLAELTPRLIMLPVNLASSLAMIG